MRRTLTFPLSRSFTRGLRSAPAAAPVVIAAAKWLVRQLGSWTKVRDALS